VTTREGRHPEGATRPKVLLAVARTTSTRASALLTVDAKNI
jgi:hypothetical protein